MYKVGDKIVCIDTGRIDNSGSPAYDLNVGQVYTVQATTKSRGMWYIKTKECSLGYKAARFKPVKISNEQRIAMRRAKV